MFSNSNLIKFNVFSILLWWIAGILLRRILTLWMRILALRWIHRRWSTTLWIESSLNMWLMRIATLWWSIPWLRLSWVSWRRLGWVSLRRLGWISWWWASRLTILVANRRWLLWITLWYGRNRWLPHVWLMWLVVVHGSLNPLIKLLLCMFLLHHHLLLQHGILLLHLLHHLDL